MAGAGSTPIEPNGGRREARSPTEAALFLLRLRRQRENVFGAALFADPAWDMLLDLLVAENTGRSITVSSLCVAATVPPTTAHRWIQVLKQAGLILMRPHATDRRMRVVILAPHASQQLRALLADL